MVPDTRDPAGMAMRPAASCTSPTTVAVNESPGLAVRELMVAVVAMDICRNASSVRVTLTLDVSFFVTSAAWLDGWQAARAARLTAVTSMREYFGFMIIPL